ncbi:MAG: methyltransferase domain-containing protein [Desulfobacterales bacterium]|jgi:ubiquinone/menaquinone biosynthesis C-methylase UbiE|nr:methyltransferase domain-containing protein [Desulfobacteraceae bacterium]MBT7086249.1 methyltransferase domain-containing protein [Desulfobacterales bacterium]MBT7697788.1 methyltransferase domain-containing protein [Desulfobacterales bacterium]
MKKQKNYSNESALSDEFTEKNNILYSKIAKGYDILIKVLPIWNNWNSHAIPHIEGKRVLEVSFGTGLLLSKYASNYETFGIDYNPKMVEIAKKNIRDKGISAQLLQGNVESLPYNSNSFDTVLNTMAFTGYPDSLKAMSELNRVLKPGGKLIMVDINFPKNMNILGMLLTKFWILLGDVIRDMEKVFNHFDLDYTDKEIGGFGSVHLYIATKSSKEVITQQID